MHRAAGALGIAAFFSLTGCQTALVLDTTVADVSSTAEIAALSSDELGRLGRRDLSAGFPGKAERYFRAAVEKNGEDPAAWLGLAAAYDNLARYDLADRAYEQVLRLQGETAGNLNNRGYSALLRGDTRRALALFKRAQALEPQNAVVANNILLLRSAERPTRTAPL